MRQRNDKVCQASAVKVAVAGMATVAISAVGVTTMIATPRFAAVNVVPLAAIDESSDTIGFADSDLYGMTPAQIDAQLDQMQAMGVNDVRVMIPWAGVEPYPGYYNWGTVDYVVNAADSRGMGVLGVLNSTPSWATQPGQPALSGAPASPQAHGDFAGTVAQRYAGKVGAYEIWNEPNAYIFYSPQPDPAGYTNLLKAAYPEIKAADPKATVIGGVVGSVVTYGNYTMNPVDFVDGIYAAGGEPYFDALSFHPYQYTTPFSQGGYLPDSPVNQLAAMHDLMVANGDGDKLIWASEYGEPSSVAGEANQAAYLQDMLTKWRTLGYTGPAFVWTLQDRNTSSTDPEDTFGVVRSDGTWKPAAYVIQGLTSQGAPTQAAARTALVAPTQQQPAPAAQNPLDAMMQTAANSLAAAGQLMATTLAQATGATTAPPPTTIPATTLDAPPAIRQTSDDAPTPPRSPRDERRAQRLSDRAAERATQRPADRSEARTAPATRGSVPKQSTPRQSTDSPKRTADKRDRSTDDRQKSRQERRRG